MNLKNMTLGLVYTLMLQPKFQDLKLSCSYLTTETSEGYKLFSRLLVERNGFCVTREFPERLRQSYGIFCEILWLSKTNSRKSVDPTNFEKILYYAREFLEKNPKSVILLDGVDYLVVQNDFTTTMRFLYQLNDYVKVYKSSLIVVQDPETFSERERRVFEKEFLKL